MSRISGREGRRGQTLVLFAGGIIAFIGMVGLVIDGGNAFAQQRRTQNGADASAEAGATQLARKALGVPPTANDATWDQRVLDAVNATAAANDLTIVGASQYTDVSGVVLGPVGTGTIPVDRSGGKAAQVAMDTGLAILRSGELFGIYPEGTRSPDGRLYRGKTGVARLALESGARVIPVAMLNTDEIQPPGKILPKIRRVQIRFGEPLDFGRYAGMAGDRFVERAITDEIMYELMELSGREYVDVYAATLKAAPAVPVASVVVAGDRTPATAA